MDTLEQKIAAKLKEMGSTKTKNEDKDKSSSSWNKDDFVKTIDICTADGNVLCGITAYAKKLDPEFLEAVSNPDKLMMMLLDGFLELKVHVPFEQEKSILPDKYK